MSHGSGNEQSKQASKKYIARTALEQEVQRQLGLTEWEPINDPYSALSEHAGKSRAIESILFQKVEELASLRQYGGDLGDRIDVVFEAWERASTRYSSEIMGMARLDLTDRIARVQSNIDEMAAQVVRDALASALSAVTLSSEDKDAILREFGTRLRGEPVPALAP